jgi:ElaB/YqjD/DUF883 family membrane-anchored ribosome-binding protein
MVSEVKSNLKAFAERVDDTRKRTADTLESAADSVRTAGNESAAAIHHLTEETGKRLDSTASVVRNTCVSEKLLGGFRNSIRRNPMTSLAVAAAFGILAGFSCRR